ncbi:MAG: ABC transporter permease [Candidatus Acidiferrales bacterium]
MPTHTRLTSLLRNLFRKQRRDQELDDEVRAYAEMLAEEKMSQGMKPQEARRAARIELGGVEQVKEQVRDVRAGAWLDIFFQDLRYGARMLRRSPGFAVVAVLTLALGIGVNTSIFSFIDALLFQPLAVKSPEQIVNVYSSDAKENDFHFAPMSYPDMKDFRDHSRSFSALMGYAETGLAIQTAEDSELVLGEVVTENYFSALGVNPLLGRMFDPSSHHAAGDDPEAVLGYSLWQRKFGADPQIVGKTLLINGSSIAIIGIAPKEFRGVFRGISPDIWVPISMDSALHLGNPIEDRGSQWMWAMGRLKPGVSVMQARTELDTLASRLAREYPASNKDRSVKILRADQVKFLPDIDGAISTTSFVLLGLVGLVLLIACANLAGMLLARASSRRKELAVRIALGAGRLRLIRQMLTESLLLSLLGGIFALLLTVWFNSALSQALASLKLPIPAHVVLGLNINGRVLGYELAIVGVTTLLFGLIPALRASGGSSPDGLKEETRSATGSRRKLRTLNVLVVGQIAISMLLLTCAGLSLRSLLNAYRVNPGFDATGVATASFYPSMTGYTDTQISSFYRQLTERVGALPGVSSVALAERVPLNLTIHVAACAPEGKDIDPVNNWLHADRGGVGPRYFETMRIPLLEGREFSELDTANSPLVVIVNETLAKKFWPGQNPMGQKLRFGGEEKYSEVVGVARDGKYRTLGEDSRPFVYRALTQVENHDILLLVRASGDPRPFLAAIREQSRQLDVRMPVTQLQTLEERIGVSLLLPKAGAALFGLFGVLGFVLASVGLYGVISYTASQRTHEIGIRMALGARPREILKLIVSQGLALAVIGVTIGLAGALTMTRILSIILYGVSARDPLTFIGISLVLLSVAVLACYIPARRAMRVDPMVALRYE